MSVRRSILLGLAVGLVVGACVAVVVGSAMLSTNNQGEFADSVTGEWTPHFYAMLGLIIAMVALPITGFFAVIGLATRYGDEP